MKRNPFETVLGCIVLCAAASFLLFAISKIDVEKIDGYDINIVFAKCGGLVKGTDVRISGIKVGTVTDISLSEDYTAKVRITVKNNVKLPKDTVAIIASDGLMGGKYIKLEPGHAAEKIAGNGAIKKTKEYRSLEDTVGELIFLATQ